MANAGKNGLTPFGFAVRIAAIKQEMTLTQVAEEAGTSYRILYHIMHGIRPGHKHRHKIAEILGIDISEYVA